MIEISIPNWQKGGTLSQIAKKYNTSVDAIMKANPTIKDPNKIVEGQKLSIPTLAGSLNEERTNATGGSIQYPSAGSADRTLPDASTADRMSSFQTMLKKITDRVKADTGSAMYSQMAGKGFDPTKVSGGTLADVTNYINNYGQNPLNDSYKATMEWAKESLEKSQANIKMLVDSGAITNIDDKTLALLANSSGIDYEILLGVRESKKLEAKQPSSFTVVEKADGKYRVGFDKMGNIVSQTKIAELTSDNDSAITDILKEAADAIQNGADPLQVKRRFLEKYPGKNSLFDNYIGDVEL